MARFLSLSILVAALFASTAVMGQTASSPPSKCCCYERDFPGKLAYEGSPRPGYINPKFVAYCEYCNPGIQKIFDQCYPTQYQDCCCYSSETFKLEFGDALRTCSDAGVRECPSGPLFQRTYGSSNRSRTLIDYTSGRMIPIDFCPEDLPDPRNPPEEIEEVLQENPCASYSQRSCEMENSCFGESQDVCSSTSPCNTDECIVIEVEFNSLLYIAIDPPGGLTGQFRDSSCVYIKNGGSVPSILARSQFQVSEQSVCVFVEEGGFLGGFSDGNGNDVVYIRNGLDRGEDDPSLGSGFLYKFEKGDDRLVIDGDSNNLFYDIESSGASLKADLCNVGDFENTEQEASVNITASGDGQSCFSFQDSKIRFADAGSSGSDTCIVKFSEDFETGESRSVELFRYIGCETFVGTRTRNPCLEWNANDTACNVENSCTPIDAPCHVGSPCNQECVYIDYNHMGRFYLKGRGSFDGRRYPTSDYSCMYISTPSGSVTDYIFSGLDTTEGVCIFVDNGGTVGPFILGNGDDVVYIESANLDLEEPGTLKVMSLAQGDDAFILKNVKDVSGLSGLKASSVKSNYSIDACQLTGSFVFTVESVEGCVSLNDSAALDTVQVSRQSRNKKLTCYASLYEGFRDAFFCTEMLPPPPLFNPCETLDFSQDCSIGENSCVPVGTPCHVGSPCNTTECLFVDYTWSGDFFLGTGFEGGRVEVIGTQYKCMYTTGSAISRDILASYIPTNSLGSDPVCIIVDDADAVISIVGSGAEDVIYVRDSVLLGGVDAAPGFGSEPDVVVIADTQLGPNGFIHDTSELVQGRPVQIDVCDTIILQGRTIVFDGIESKVDGTAGITTSNVDDCISVKNSQVSLLNAKGDQNDRCTVEEGILTNTSAVIEGCAEFKFVEFEAVGALDIDNPDGGCLFGPWEGDIPIAAATVTNLDYEDFVPNTRVSISRNANTCSGCTEEFHNKRCKKRCEEAGSSSFSYTAHFSITNFESNRFRSIPEGGRCTAKDSLVMILNVTGCSYLQQEIRQRHPCLSITPVQSTVQITPASLAKTIDPGISVHELAEEHAFFVLRGSCLPAGATIEFDLRIEGCSNVPLIEEEQVSCVDVAARLVTGKCSKMLNDWVNCRPNQFGIISDSAMPNIVSFPYDYTKCFFRDRHLLQQTPTRINRETGGCPRTACPQLPAQAMAIASAVASGHRTSSGAIPSKHRTHDIIQHNRLDNYHRQKHRHSKRSIVEEPASPSAEEPVTMISNAIPAVEAQDASGPVAYILNTVGEFAFQDPRGCFYNETAQTVNETLLERFKCFHKGSEASIGSINGVCARSNREPQIIRLGAIVEHFSGTEGYRDALNEDVAASGVVKVDFARYHPRLKASDGFRPTRDLEPLCGERMNVLFDFLVSDTERSVSEVLGTERFIHRIEQKTVFLDADDDNNNDDGDFDTARIDRVTALYSFDSLFPGEHIMLNVYYASCDIRGEFEPRLSLRVTLLESNSKGVDCELAGARDVRCSTRLDVATSLDDFEGERELFGCEELGLASSYITPNNSGNHRWLAFSLVFVVVASCAALCCIFCVIQWTRKRKTIMV